jgi:hypothetical protein
MWTCPKWLIEIPYEGPNGNSQIIYRPCHDSTFNLKIAKNIQILLFCTRALLGLLIISAHFLMAKFRSKKIKFFEHGVILEVFNHHKCGAFSNQTDFYICFKVCSQKYTRMT